MASVTIKVLNSKEVQKFLKEKTKESIKLAEQGVEDGLAYLQLMLKQSITHGIYAPKAVDMGQFVNSVEKERQGLGGKVFSNLSYAKYIEYGSSPHFPPLEPLKAWAGRVLHDESAAFPVARKIAQVGIPARPHFRNTAMAEKANVIAVIKNKMTIL